MREYAREFVTGRISRRSFVQSLTGAGFSLAAARSALGSLEPLTAAGPTPSEGPGSFVGSGGALLAEQLKEFQTRFIFVCNSSGMGPLADALIDRPQLQFIQAVSEHQTMAIADGFAKASG
ncbi:MAG: thiamine pyrophosphate-binding protein [Acidobacteriota bacterium]